MTRDTIRVLHVDDDASLRDLAETFLERVDSTLKIISKPSAQAGLEQLKHGTIDCIVSDYKMSGMDGLEFLKAVRTEYATLPFILYTGKGSEEIAAEAINAGVDAYYQKEVGTGQYTVLAQHISNLVEKHSAEQRLDYLEQEKHIADGGSTIFADEDSLHESDLQYGAESVSMAVVEAVATREDVDPVALTPPLHEAIDPEALDAFFTPQSAETNQGADSVTFTYHGYTVTVSNNGRVKLDK